MSSSDLAEPEALLSRLAALARHSGPGAGVTRLVYDDAWCDAHEWLRAQASELGLAAPPDAVGNLYLHRRGLAPGATAIFVGSHLDSVAHGGTLDGAYGTVSAMLLAAG